MVSLLSSCFFLSFLSSFLPFFLSFFSLAVIVIVTVTRKVEGWGFGGIGSSDRVKTNGIIQSIVEYYFKMEGMGRGRIHVRK